MAFLVRVCEIPNTRKLMRSWKYLWQEKEFADFEYCWRDDWSGFNDYDYHVRTLPVEVAYARNW